MHEASTFAYRGLNPLPPAKFGFNSQQDYQVFWYIVTGGKSMASNNWGPIYSETWIKGVPLVNNPTNQNVAQTVPTAPQGPPFVIQVPWNCRRNELSY